MDRRLAFSTFLKLLELPQPQKAAALRGFKRGGGFNYWHPMQVLAREVANRELDLSGVQQKVAAMAKGHQRKYNVNALTNLLKWVIRRKITPLTRPEKVIKKFGNSGLKVRIAPELAFRMGGNNYFMHVWATNNPSLSPETLSMGLYFFRRHFRKAGYENYQYLIFDTVKDSVFGEFNIFENASEMLADQRELLSEIWASIDKEMGQPTKKIPSDDRPSDRPGTQP